MQHLFNKYRPKIKLLQSLLGIFLIAGCSQKMDDSEFYLLSGEKKQIKDYQESWLLINFWAEWCRPCIEEVPILNELQASSEDLNLQVLAFSYEKYSNEELHAAAERYQMKYPLVATDPQPVVPFQRPNKLPGLYIYSPDGVQFGPIYGKQTRASIGQLIETLSKQ
ncbi:MAG: TlpA family protein disulfide reductase [Gammaproteobacteria bacterium]|nr:TlpA family protein disulfide reductase [Gammaproteobacteria bacterium]